MVQLIPGDSNRAGTLPLLCLAPRGVYRASLVTLGAVGSYSTFSPLPTEVGGLFSAALSVQLTSINCPSLFARRATLWRPDFPRPHRLPNKTATVRGAAGTNYLQT